jgi:hypothetical protein
LEEQMRVQDPVWEQILHRVCSGDCTSEDIKGIHKLALTNPQCDLPDFTTSPWNEAMLVTSWNSIHLVWNSGVLKHHCQRSGQTYAIVAHNVVKNQSLMLQQ